MFKFVIIYYVYFNLNYLIVKTQSGRGTDAWYLEESQWPPVPHAFEYEIRDPYGNEQYRRERSDGRRVTGSYGYYGPDGVYRHVDYIADEYGFRANIRTNEPGVGYENPASVRINGKPYIYPSPPPPPPTPPFSNPPGRVLPPLPRPIDSSKPLPPFGTRIPPTPNYGGRDDGRQPRPGTRPDGRPVTRPDGRPVTRPDGRPVTRPDGRPSTRPDGRPVTRPDGRPSTRPDGRPDNRPGTQPSRTPNQETNLGGIYPTLDTPSYGNRRPSQEGPGGYGEREGSRRPQSPPFTVGQGGNPLLPLPRPGDTPLPPFGTNIPSREIPGYSQRDTGRQPQPGTGNQIPTPGGSPKEPYPSYQNPSYGSRRSDKDGRGGYGEREGSGRRPSPPFSSAGGARPLPPLPRPVDTPLPPFGTDIPSRESPGYGQGSSGRQPSSHGSKPTSTQTPGSSQGGIYPSLDTPSFGNRRPGQDGRGGYGEREGSGRPQLPPYSGTPGGRKLPTLPPPDEIQQTLIPFGTEVPPRETSGYGQKETGLKPRPRDTSPPSTSTPRSTSEGAYPPLDTPSFGNRRPDQDDRGGYGEREGSGKGSQSPTFGVLPAGKPLQTSPSPEDTQQTLPPFGTEIPSRETPGYGERDSGRQPHPSNTEAPPTPTTGYPITGSTGGRTQPPVGTPPPGGTKTVSRDGDGYGQKDGRKLPHSPTPVNPSRERYTVLWQQLMARRLTPVVVTQSE